MTPDREQDGIHPSLLLGVLKEAIGYPEHQSMPILGKICAIALPRILIELQEPRAPTS
jgi:hypothetical protein